MSRKELRAKKYAYVMNKYQKSDLARKARDWSWSRIYKELAIKTPSKRTIKKIQLKEYSKQTKYQKSMQYKKVKEMLKLGWVPLEASKDKRKSYKKIDKKTTKMQFTEESLKIYKKRTRKDRFNIWLEWSSDTLPNNLQQKVNKLNMQEGLSTSNHYGYALVYLMYIENIPEDQAKEMIVLDESTYRGYVVERRV